MRITLLAAFLVLAISLVAQTNFPGSFMNHTPSRMLASNHVFNVSTQRKWFVTKYSALSASYSFFKGGGASIVAAPVGLQLNRRLNANLYAFVNATFAPAYVTFNRSFMAGNFSKGVINKPFFGSGSLQMYSSASMGLLYINKEKNFSLSGSISVERSSYPLLPYYRTHDTKPNTNSYQNR